MPVPRTQSDVEVEQHYRDRIASAQKAATDKSVHAALARLDNEMRKADEELRLARSQMDAVVDNPTKIEHVLAACKFSEDRVMLLQEAVDAVLPPDGTAATSLLTSFVSGAASKKLRDAAFKGVASEIVGLLAEQKKWPKYMVMQSCDEPDPLR
eukprot:SAG22_NODE_69_length_22779_cov_71.088139_20_plen_154_part_00